jgi:ribosome-binding protein aMBF1 (putative translation factor)
MDRKTCFKCGKEKDLDEFYKHPMMADGHLNKCKECAKADVRQHRRDNPGRLQEYELKRRKDPERRKNQARYNKNAQVRERTKYIARYMVRNAIRDGRLKQGSCEDCGGTEAIEAHHDDYCRPLDVTWLCFQCHQQRHGKRPNVERRFKETDNEPT